MQNVIHYYDPTMDPWVKPKENSFLLKMHQFSYGKRSATIGSIKQLNPFLTLNLRYYE